ncbi:MAG: DUF2029 domain-containing protein, partial [Pseudonocardia sp.]|nr:DUF2029 domain-containing protein [Pseudonocardia sp.]
DRRTPERQARPWSGLVAAAAGAILGVAVFWLMRRVMTDDAYIAMDYARQLGLHGSWGMVDGLGSNTATSPLSILLLGALTAILRDPVWAVGALLIAGMAVSGWWLHGIAAALHLGRWVFPPLALAVLAVNPLLMSAMGLESHLAVALLVGAGWAVVTRRPAALGVLAGLLILTRPDLGPAALVAVLCLPGGRWRAFGAAVAVTVPWFAWSWWFLGSAVPDTIVIKGPESWGGTSFWNSLPHYYSILPAAIALSVLPAAVGVLALAWWWRERLAWVWAGAAAVHYATMSLLHPGPFFWHTTFFLSGLSLLGTAAICRYWARRGLLPGLLLTGAAAYVLVTAVSSVNDGLPRDRFAPVSFNWGSPAQYQAIAETIPAGTTVQSPGEIGTLAYYCDCRVVDQFADRGQFTPLLDKRLATAGPVTRQLLEWNYHRFDRPAPARLDYRIQARMVPPGEPAQMTSLFTRYGRQVTITPVG